MTIQLTISGEPESLLRDLSKLSGKNLNETFRKALATEPYFSKHVKVGYKILLQASDGKIKQVILK